MTTLKLTDKQVEELEELARRSDTGANEEDNPWHSVQFDIHKWSEDAKFDALASKLASLGLPSSGIRKERLVVNMKVVLLNLYSCCTQCGSMYIAYSRGQNTYKASSRYNELSLNRKYVVHAVDTLLGNDLLDHFKGFDGRLPRMRANETLRHFFAEVGGVKIITHPARECIILRDEDKNLIPYGREVGKQDSRTVQGMRKRLSGVNELLARSDIRLSISDSDLCQLNIDRRKEGMSEIDLSKVFLRRIFNEKFNLGGRHYDGWWQYAPKGLRPHITIDGRETVELDFSSIHPCLLYLHEARSLPEGDPYTLPAYKGDEGMRKLMKRVFLVLLNAPTLKSAKGALRKDIPKDAGLSESIKARFKELDLDALFSQIKESHPVIQDHFGAGRGPWLQFLDSKIADQVLTEMTEMNIVCLPVFDSFIVQRNYGLVLKETMKKAFIDQWGACPKIDKK